MPPRGAIRIEPAVRTGNEGREGKGAVGLHVSGHYAGDAAYTQPSGNEGKSAFLTKYTEFTQ